MEKQVKINWWLPVLNIIIILGLFLWGNICLHNREQKSQLDQASLEQVQQLKKDSIDYEKALSDIKGNVQSLFGKIDTVDSRIDKLEETVAKLLGCKVVCDEQAGNPNYIGNCARQYPYEVWDSIEVKPWIYKVFYQSMFLTTRQKQYNETYESKPAKVGALKCFTLEEVVWTAQE